MGVEMKKMKYTILIACLLAIVAITYIINQDGKNNISHKKGLGNILGIELNDRTKIKNIQYIYSDNDYTHIFLYMQVDKKYADQVSYFMNNGRTGFSNNYTNIEKKFNESLNDPALAGYKIIYDNSVFPEGVDINLLPKARGIEGYSVLVFRIDRMEDKAYAEFLVEALIPAKLKINLHPE